MPGKQQQVLLCLLMLWVWGAARNVCGDEMPVSEVPVSAGTQFLQAVRPLLEAKCISCHGEKKQEGGLRLDTLQAALKGGEQGPAVVPGEPQQSLLVQAVLGTDADLQMPPGDALSAEQADLLRKWVQNGAVWPRQVLTLFDDEEAFLGTLSKGTAAARFERSDAFSGTLAVAVAPREKYAEQIADWSFAIREQPAEGEYRYLRFAWKKTGGGGAMLEVAREGQWPPANADPPPGGRYVAGPNETGMDAIVVADAAPAEWTEVTIDLWQDLGDCNVTGLSLMASGSGETLFDSFLLSASIADLSSWRPGLGVLAFQPAPGSQITGTAFEDPENAIYRMFDGQRLDLWSLQPAATSVADELSQTALNAATIDQFIERELQNAGIQALGEADRRTLIRRLSFDLTGLPPDPDAVATFVNDESPAAYAALVDRLLSGREYGERQASLWLDVVRYADTNGYERDEFRPLIWMYRDYVVRSFHSDKPFDQFVREQLAGDELVNGVPQTAAEADALIATGYLRLGQWDSTASIFQEEDRLRAEIMADLTNTTASAFLGLTMSCCQCHDHKYDPLSQADHYRLRAFFAGVTPRDDLAVEVAADRDAIERHNAALEQQLQSLQEALKQLDQEQESGRARHAELSGKIAELEQQKQELRVAMGATDAGPVAPPTYVLYQGVFRDPRDEVAPGFPAVLYPGPAAVESPAGTTTGRRLTLARWITSAENPWTARVIVNRIWQQHFGAGLVDTANDFGMTGARPTHPELLDWLATAFVRTGWSIKDLHRAIVMSRTYRRSSNSLQQMRHASAVLDGAEQSVSAGDTERAMQQAVRIDPLNHLLWRQNVRRLNAETLRDSLLAVSGLLRDRDGGKPVWPEVPEELLQAQPAILEAIEGKDGVRQQGWYTDEVEATDVRSLYLVRKRCLPIPFLQAFDLPDTTVSCARRDTTVVAPQALMLLNSPSALRYAEAFAERVREECQLTDSAETLRDMPSRVIQAVFQLALERDPQPEELLLAKELLVRHQQQHQLRDATADAGRLALVDLCRAMFNLNEFLYLD